MNAKKLVVFALITVSSSSIFGQITNLGKPKSWNLKTDPISLTTLNMPAFDREMYRIEDSINEIEKTAPWRFGHKYEVNYSLNTSGSWTNLPNGDRIWRLKIKSKDALSLNFIFENMYLPLGSSVMIHRPDKSAYLGAYTSINNSPSKILGTDLISGEEAIIEYYEPSYVYGQGTLTIATIVHGYRDISLHENQMMKALNSSDDCNRDVKCLTNPEPLWVNESNAVAMIVVNGNGSCTGTLVNNTAQDGKAYFLTANHCLGTPATWAFRFKWIAPNPDCATTANTVDMPNNTQFQTMNGSVLRASNAGSDFALVEITNLTLATAQQWGLYYAGWDHTGAAVSAAIGIHHPSGDIMKYARESNALLQAAWQGAQTWHIQNWDEGVTEPGSSGSGLWDLNHRLIGQLYGGSAACSGTNDNSAPDYYGRFDVSWNGNSASTRLRDWLDPSGISTGTLDGWDPNSSAAALDAGLQNVTSPTGSYCATGEVTPSFSLRNVGSDELTQASIEYSFDGGAPQTYTWTGSLATNETDVITLPVSTLGNGAHTFSASLVTANGTTDENAANNTVNSNFTIILNGQTVDFSLTIDCWGSETTWTVLDESSAEIATGGPYNDDEGGQVISNQWCLAEGCYTFTIEDTYGDGMNGAQYQSCGLNGTYAIIQDGDTLASMLAANSNFGDAETNTFCVGADLTAAFSASDSTVCAGSAVNFTNLSEGTITGYTWTFVGGTPATSTEQNPVVTYSQAGTYDVVLTVTDGTNEATQTLTGFITVNAVPATPSITTASGTSNICSGSTVVLSSSSSLNNTWSTGENTQEISVSQAGTYTLTVTENACSASSEITLVEAETPLINVLSTTNPSACSVADGSVNIGGATGTGDLLWTGSASGEALQVNLPYTVSGLAAGSYSFTFNNGCTSEILAVNIVDPNAPAVPTITSLNGLTACEGETLVLTSSVSTGIEWSTGETSESISVTTSGSYFVTLNDGPCSSTSEIVEVIFNANPTLPTISPAGTVAICAGDSLELVASTSTDVVWSSGETSASILVENGGTYTVTVTNSNGCSTSSAPVVVVVNALPTAPSISSADGFEACQGETITLISSESTGNTWSTNATTSTIDVTQSGMYTVSVTDANGCSATSTPVTVTIFANPTINAGQNQNVCVGGSVTLTATGGVSYVWNNGVSNGVTFVPTQTTVYSVTGTDANGCTGSDDVQVVVNPLPTVSLANLGTVCVDEAPYVLSGGSPAGGTYSGPGISSNLFTAEIAGVGTHDIIYTFTSQAGCSNTATGTITVDACASVLENELMQVSVYPNPVDNKLTIEAEKEVKFTISDASGRIVYTSEVAVQKATIDVSEFQSGVYFVNLENNSNISTLRFIKK
jgi:PKD repeat protein